MGAQFPQYPVADDRNITNVSGQIAFYDETAGEALCTAASVYEYTGIPVVEPAVEAISRTEADVAFNFGLTPGYKAQYPKGRVHLFALRFVVQYAQTLDKLEPNKTVVIKVTQRTPKYDGTGNVTGMVVRENEYPITIRHDADRTFSFTLFPYEYKRKVMRRSGARDKRLLDSVIISETKLFYKPIHLVTLPLAEGDTDDDILAKCSGFTVTFSEILAGSTVTVEEAYRPGGLFGIIAKTIGSKID